MKARNFIGVALLAVAFMLGVRPALALAGAGIEIGYFNDFQKSLDKFVPGSVSDSCVTKDTLKLSFERGPSYAKSELPGKFNGFAELTNTCGYPIWMLANLTGSGKVLRIEFDTRDLQGCEGCIALVYAGKTVPKYPGQFSTDYRSLGKSWQKHVLKVSVAPTVDAVPQDTVQDTVIVAIGFTNLDYGVDGCVVQRVGIDNVTVTLDDGVPPNTN